MTLSSETLVRSEPYGAEEGQVLLVQPTIPVDLATWAREQREWIDGRLAVSGGILFRGFQISTAAALDRVIAAVAGESLEYRERSSPRHQVSGNVYTSTEYPADQAIFLHCENSYQHAWPQRLFFACAVASETQGRTPLADTRRVYQHIDPAIRQQFEARRVMYVRNFGEGVGLPWQVVFQTSDRSAVEAYCTTAGIECTWRDGNRLRTRQVRPAVIRHPRSGEMAWFNHAAFFHVSTLAPAIREALLSQFEEEDLPSNSYYGDGAPIDPAVAEHLRAAYAAATRSFPWQVGDLLLLDNILMAHGREPFTGQRSVLVGMALPAAWSDFS